MGHQSQKFFDHAARLGGLAARIRLASLAQMTSAEATPVPDGPDLLGRLDKAFQRVRTEFAQREPRPATGTAPGAVETMRHGSEEVKLLRRHLQTYLDLMSQRSLFLGDVNTTIRLIDEASATTLDVARVSVWFLDKARTKITCADL